MSMLSALSAFAGINNSSSWVPPLPCFLRPFCKHLMLPHLLHQAMNSAGPTALRWWRGALQITFYVSDVICTRVYTRAFSNTTCNIHTNTCTQTHDIHKNTPALGTCKHSHVHTYMYTHMHTYRILITLIQEGWTWRRGRSEAQGVDPWDIKKPPIFQL